MHEDELVEQVAATVDALIEAGDPYGGLFPSMLDRETGEMLREIPDPIPGQREHDRAHHGTNLIHDEPILRAMYALADAEDRPAYADAADRYIETFATECTRPDHEVDGDGSATGLFPWGEHAYWHLLEERVGNGREYGDDDDPGPAIHDHLRLVPAWLWEKLYRFNPAAVHRFADGLEYHYNDPEKPEYVRHAYITEKGRFPMGDRACDFPRHGGHYVHDWAFAYTKDPHSEYRRLIRKTMDYWWEKRDPDHGGMVRFESRGRTHEIDGAQTLSLALSLFDAADLLEAADLEADLREEMRDRAETYAKGFEALPHDLEDDVFLTKCRERDLDAGEFEPLRDVEAEITPQTTWVSAYGGGSPAAGSANRTLCAYRHTGHEWFLAFAEAVGEHYLDNPFPEGGVLPIEETNIGLAPSTRRTMPDEDEGIPVRASSAGTVLGLYADLYDLTREEGWLDRGLELAEKCLGVYFDADLPRAATTVDHYESQLGPAFLVYNLARIALLARGDDLEPNYTSR